MRNGFLTLWILVWNTILGTVLSAGDLFVPASSPAVLYDDGWTNYTNPDYMMSRNGSVFFLYRGSNFSIHGIFQDTGPNLNLYIDGNLFVYLSLYANYLGVSSIDSTLREYAVTLSHGDHQVYLSLRNLEMSSYLPFVLGGFSVSGTEDGVEPDTFGINPRNTRVDQIIDDSGLNYKGSWAPLQSSPFSYNHTSTYLNTPGSSVSITLPHDVTTIGVYGTSPAGNATFNVTVSPPNSQATVLPTVIQSYEGGLIRAPLWSYGQHDKKIPAGSVMEIGIVEAKFNIDYVLLRYPDDVVGGSASPLKIVKIVVPSIVGTIIVAACIGFWLWRRRRRRGWMSKFGQKRLKGNSEIALKDISGDETISGDGADQGETDGVHLPPPYPSRSELSLASERMRVSPHLVPLPSSTENAVSSQSGTNTTTTTASGSQPSGSSHQLHLQPPVSSEREAEPGPPRRSESLSLPTWSPPPPSYQSMISIMASESSMIPLSQDALERLYQRVTVLRRLNSQPSPSGGGGGGEKLGGIVEEDEAEGEEESDEELEALARRIAGIGTSSAARPEAEKR